MLSRYVPFTPFTKGHVLPLRRRSTYMAPSVARVIQPFFLGGLNTDLIFMR